MNKFIQVKTWALVLALLLSLSAGAALCLLARMELSFDAGCKVCSEDIVQQVRDAVNEGTPFFLKGTDIKITPGRHKK